MAAVIVDERRAIGLPALGIAERVELELGARQDAELVEDAGADGDDLDIGLRLRRADQLDIDLMELPEAPLLRPLVAEHRAVREELERQALRQPVRDDRRA